MKREFAENLTRIMKGKGVSVVELSELTGMHIRQIYKYRSPRMMETVDPSAYNVKLLSKALGVSMDDLYGDIE